MLERASSQCEGSDRRLTASLLRNDGTVKAARLDTMSKDMLLAKGCGTMWTSSGESFDSDGKLGALTMMYVCTHCSTGHNVREKKAQKKAFRLVEWRCDNRICDDADTRLGRRTRRSGGETTQSGINDCHQPSRLG